MNSVGTFADHLLNAIDAKKSYVVVGLDPEYSMIPKVFRSTNLGRTTRAIGDAIISFNCCIIDTVANLVPAVKPNIAFYEQYGTEGIFSLLLTIRYAKAKGLIVIEDIKRGDVPHSASAYARGHLGSIAIDDKLTTVFNADAITVSPYLGLKSITPYLEYVKRDAKGIFVLVKTSCESVNDIQEAVLQDGNTMVFERIGMQVNSLSNYSISSRNYSSVGAVVNAQVPKHTQRLRGIMPKTLFLVPGYDAQGVTATQVLPCFNKDGYGALITSSRAVTYPNGITADISRGSFQELVKNEVDHMNQQINGILSDTRILPW